MKHFSTKNWLKAETSKIGLNTLMEQDEHLTALRRWNKNVIQLKPLDPTKFKLSQISATVIHLIRFLSVTEFSLCWRLR